MNSFTHVLSEKQEQSFNDSYAKINIWQGAVRSGKTFISLLRFVTELANGPDGEYAMISRTYDSFKRNILAELVRIIGGKDTRHFVGKRELSIFGKTVHIIGADDERAEAKIRGATFAGAYVDELTIIPESVFRMLISRCAMGEARIFATTNPDSPYHWAKVSFLTDNPDVLTWKFTLFDNPELTDKDREFLTRQYKGLWFQRFIEGIWVQAEGSVYDFFNDQTHVIDYPPTQAATYFAGIDYGTTNPCAFVLIGHNPSVFPNLWVEKEYYYDSKVHQRQKTDAEYCDDLKAFLKGYNVSHIYVDPSAVSFRIQARKEGIEGLYEAKNEVLDGIRVVSRMIDDGKLKITRHCKNLIKEFGSYVWDSKALMQGVDKPKKTNDHLLDALRYAIFTHLFGKEEGGLSPQEIDRLYNETRGYDSSMPPIFQNNGYAQRW